MNLNWRRLTFQLLFGLFITLVLLFASSTTSTLHSQEQKIHAGATREPQSADPASSFFEIVMESSPLGQLSAGFIGIAPSMHMIRLDATRPLSNIDPIENPARRRYGRIDFSFAFLVFLPIVLIPLCYLIYQKCTARGDAENLASGRTKLFDFIIERILLPILGSGGLIFLVTIACFYSSGLRLNDNELLGRLTLWALLTTLYLLCWILLFAFLLIRSRMFATATIQYAAIFLLLVFVFPQFIQSVQLSLERPKGRLPLIVERRKLMAETKADDQAAIDRFLTRQGLPAINWSEPLTKAQSVALVNLRIEEKIAPRLKEFEDNVRKLDEMAIMASWISPYTTAQFGVDDLAGTGLSRYSAFRTAAIAYHEQWRKYALGFIARRQILDFDSLRNAPKFKSRTEDSGEVFFLGSLRCLYFLVIAILLTFGINRELRKILPKQKKAAR
jgi:ABC-2 type transport system permease protein